MIEARGLFNMTSQKVPTVSSSRTCLITPATPTPLAQLKLPLSPLDLILPSFYTPVILVYASLGHHSFQTALNNFKSTLSKTLVAFYPLAGRLVKGEDGVPIIMCNDAGAYLTEVVVEEGLESLGGQQVLPLFTGMEATNLGSAGWYSCDQHAEIPPLVLQITLFKCGAVAVAANWHHQVADGVSGMNFLKAWSEVAQGNPISSPPDHRRYLLLSSQKPPKPRLSIAGYRLLSEDQPKSVAPSTLQPKPKVVAFTITKEDILKLKKQASEGEDGGSFTSAECVSAHLWRLVSKARRLEEETVSNLYTIIDGRKRLKQDGFPLSYFGNCVFLTKAVCSVVELVNRPLGYVVSLVHDSIVGVREDDMRSFVEWINVVGASNVARERDGFTARDLQPTFWTQFPIYELDFGWGRPIFGGRNSTPSIPSPSVVVIIPSASRDGSWSLSACLHSDPADALVAAVASAS